MWRQCSGRVSGILRPNTLPGEVKVVMSTVYLAGPINGCSDDEATAWRDRLKTMLRHAVLDPMTRDCRGQEAESFTAIVVRDKQGIVAADVLCAFCPRPSVGTSMEILFAWERGKTVVLIVPPGVPVSPWLRYHSHAIVPDLDEAARVLNRMA